MKKVLFGFVAAFAMTFAACNNNAVTEEVDTVNPTEDSIEVVDTVVDSVAEEICE